MNQDRGHAPSYFHRSAVAWLRDHRGLRTRVLPEHQLDRSSDGATRVAGRFARPSRAGSWVFTALCLWVFGSVLGMYTPARTSPAESGRNDPFTQAVHHVGHGSDALAVAALTVAEIERRRHSTPAQIELRDERATPATPATIDALARGGTRELEQRWLLSSARVDAATLRRAGELGVRCFESDASGFVERPCPAAAESTPV